jgi:antitoxin component YwqK of YwqJK toxin-antitoxin module
MRKFFYFFVLITQIGFSQEIFTNSYNDVYINEGLVYKVKDDQIFTGSIAFFRNNNSLRYKLNYENGYLTSEYLYYSKSSNGKIFLESVYYPEKANLNTSKFYLHKNIRYKSTGEIKSIIYFDKNKIKYLEEYYENGKIIYSCEYKDGKKNGKEFCIDKKCGEQTYTYSKGKKIEM